MRARRIVALLAFTLLLLLLAVSGNHPAELSRRAVFLRRTAGQDPAVRRLAGSSAAFDRRFFRFLETARRRLPRGTAGVLLDLPRPTDAALYLAAYQLAPVPVRISRGAVPPGWIAAVFDAPPRAGWREIARLPDGALLLPPP